MAWLELHQALPTHRKTLALADELEIEPVHAVGHLACLWLWMLDNAEDGEIGRLTHKTIARAAQWSGSAEAFYQALEVAGFVNDGRVHDWHDYAGKLVEQRQQERERSRRRRAEQRPPTDPPPTGGRPAADPQTTVGTVPNTTVPDRTLPNHPTPNGVGVAPAPKRNGTIRAVPSFTPDEQERLNAVGVILGPLGFSPDDDAKRVILRTYGQLNLELEAVRQADWCRKHKVKTLSVSRYTNWLARAMNDLPPGQEEPEPTELRADDSPRCPECGGTNYSGKTLCFPCERKQTETTEQRAAREALLANRPRMAMGRATA